MTGEEKLLCDTSEANSVGGKKITLKEIVRQLDLVALGLQTSAPADVYLLREQARDWLKTLSTTIKQDHRKELE